MTSMISLFCALRYPDVQLFSTRPRIETDSSPPSQEDSLPSLPLLVLLSLPSLPVPRLTLSRNSQGASAARWTGRGSEGPSQLAVVGGDTEERGIRKEKQRIRGKG